MLPLVIPSFANTRTSLVPGSQICQRCAGTSCRFPVALVSRRSYSQSTQTHHSRHPLHLPGSAGSQLERENKLGEGDLVIGSQQKRQQIVTGASATETIRRGVTTPPQHRQTAVASSLISTHADGRSRVHDLREKRGCGTIGGASLQRNTW